MHSFGEFFFLSSYECTAYLSLYLQSWAAVRITLSSGRAYNLSVRLSFMVEEKIFIYYIFSHYFII